MAELSQFDDLPVVGGPTWPGVQYFSTTRLGGCSTGVWQSLNLGLHTNDDVVAVAANRQRLARSLPGQPVWLQQVHGTDVYRADDGTVVGQPATHAVQFPQADAAVSAQSGRVLTIMTADCLPVVLGCAQGTVIGVAHAGWRGLAAGVLENTLAALQCAQTRPVTTWRAWIGPGIRQDNFEVDDRVRYVFLDADPGCDAFFVPSVNSNRWMADLAGIARHRLLAAGVAQVDTSPLCTFRDHHLLYSYRRQAITGRQATLAWIVPSV